MKYFCLLSGAVRLRVLFAVSAPVPGLSPESRILPVLAVAFDLAEHTVVPDDVATLWALSTAGFSTGETGFMGARIAGGGGEPHVAGLFLPSLPSLPPVAGGAAAADCAARKLRTARTPDPTAEDICRYRLLDSDLGRNNFVFISFVSLFLLIRALFLRELTQSRRVTINLENGQVKTFWYAYVLDILLHLYTRIYPRKLEVK